jgi:hypothetical protein
METAIDQKLIDAKLVCDTFKKYGAAPNFFTIAAATAFIFDHLGQDTCKMSHVDVLFHCYRLLGSPAEYNETLNLFCD